MPATEDPPASGSVARTGCQRGHRVGTGGSVPGLVVGFLHDRQTRKPSAYTLKAYRQDFVAIATLVTGGNPARMAVTDITKDAMRAAFAGYAATHEAASIRRCWSSWNVLCTFLYTGEHLAVNPMALIGRAKLAKPLPKALPRTAVEVLLDAVAPDQHSTRRTDWAERDLALILTALLAGLRAEELRQANIGDIRTTDAGGAVIHISGKGDKQRSVPIEAALLTVIDNYLDSRATRFPTTTTRTARAAGPGLSRWPARSPLFVGRDGERITRGTLQSRIKRAFKRAGPDAQPVPGALVHGFRHSCATLLFAQGVDAATVQRILRHSSITVTTGVYMRVVEEVRRDALGGMDRLLKGEGDDTQLSAVATALYHRR